MTEFIYLHVFVSISLKKILLNVKNDRATQANSSGGVNSLFTLSK